MPALSAAESDDAIQDRLKLIGKAFDGREALEASTEAHGRWATSPAGKAELEFLAAHFDKLPSMRTYEMPMELARTGASEVVPFLRAALARPGGERALSGIFFACHYGNVTREFGIGIAPSLVPLIGKGEISFQDRAIELLPLLDPEFAKKVLFTDQYLNADSPFALLVLEACNGAGMAVPLDFVQNLIASWETLAGKKDTEYRFIRGYRAAVIALVKHDPAQSFQRIEKWLLNKPEDADVFSEVFLVAEGLTGLYEALADFSNDPDKFQQLPKAAQIYFALSLWLGDWENGGLSQALGNSTGDFFPLIKEAYKAIGDEHGVELMEIIARRFGPEGPSTNRDERLRQMAEMTPSIYESEKALMDEWAQETRDLPITRSESEIYLLNRYAAKHAEVLRPLIPVR